jgi:RNA polymerase sigma-70 factor, ECF subfamily
MEEPSNMDTRPTGDLTAELQQEVTDLYRLHAAGLLRYGGSLTRHSEIAREAVQETFLRYFAERRYGRRIDKPRTWLYIVMRNYLLRQLGSPDENAGTNSGEIDTLPSAAGDPEALVQRTEAARDIAASLSNRELQCLHLRLDGLGYSEIAEILGVKQGTVGALLARVHVKLRRAVETGGIGPEAADAVSRLALKDVVYAF